MGNYIRRDTRNYFCILAAGEHFDVDQCIGATPLCPTTVWHRGDARDGRISESSGMQIELGNGDELDWSEQQEIAADFLEMHRVAMQLLRKTPGVETCYLGLQESVMVDSLGSIMDLSPRLMKIVLELEIQLTIWSCTVQPAEP